MERSTTAERASALIAVAACSGAFAIGFNLGAFDVVFLGALLSLWVTATVLLIASLVTSLPPNGWPGRLVLLMPTVWLGLAWVSDPAATDAASRTLFAVTLAITLVCLPFIAWILVSALNPDFLRLPRQNKAAVIVAVLAFALAGFGIGARNDLFFNCDDFTISGNHTPANCVPGPRTTNPGR